MPRRSPANLPHGDSKGADREVLAAWMKQQFQENQAAHDARIELLRTGGEHPNPVHAAFAKNLGMVALDKKTVARMLNISRSTLDTYYEADYEAGRAEMLIATAANYTRISQSVTDPNNAKAALEILSRQGGEYWKPPVKQLEVDKRTTERATIDSSKLSPELREQLRRELLQITDQGSDQGGDAHEDQAG